MTHKLECDACGGTCDYAKPEEPCWGVIHPTDYTGNGDWGHFCDGHYDAEFGEPYKKEEMLLDLATKYDALSAENLELRTRLRGDAVDDRAGLVSQLLKERRWREDAEAKHYELRRKLSELSTQLEGVPPSTDRPDLRAKFLGAFDKVISTKYLEDGDQYLEPEGK